MPQDGVFSGLPLRHASPARRAAGNSLANWPEEALLYRCFAGRGVVLTEAQARYLAEWQERTASPSGGDVD